jgi:hypothetical protein
MLRRLLELCESQAAANEWNPKLCYPLSAIVIDDKPRMDGYFTFTYRPSRKERNFDSMHQALFQMALHCYPGRRSLFERMIF